MIDAGRVRLPVADVERALRFYVERLGVKLVDSPARAAAAHGAQAGEARIDLGGGFEIDLIQQAPAAPTALSLRIRGDFEEAVGTYENRGLILVRGADASGPFAECTDLDGHSLRFVTA